MERPASAFHFSRCAIVVEAIEGRNRLPLWLLLDARLPMDRTAIAMSDVDYRSSLQALLTSNSAMDIACRPVSISPPIGSSPSLRISIPPFLPIYDFLTACENYLRDRTEPAM